MQVVQRKSGVRPDSKICLGQLGSVPPQLMNLLYAEQLLISHICHSKCIIQVSSDMHKMKANVIMFENSMPKIY